MSNFEKFSALSALATALVEKIEDMLNKKPPKKFRTLETLLNASASTK